MWWVLCARVERLALSMAAVAPPVLEGVFCFVGGVAPPQTAVRLEDRCAWSLVVFCCVVFVGEAA